MKRSKSIRLVLIGSLSAGAVTSCGPSTSPGPINAQDVYTNNHHVPGVGYYHAPFRRWYPLPYNSFDPQTGRYFHGGQWSTAPHESITNISPPRPEAVQMVHAQRAPVTRSGFGRTSRTHFIHS